MTQKSRINYKGFDFDFDYNYYAGSPATYEQPEDYPEWEIFNITLDGIDASDLLDCMITDFEVQVIEHLRE